MRLGFEHSYAGLPPRFYAPVKPTAVAAPRLVVFNQSLAGELGLDVAAVEQHAANIFSGNQLPDDANPIAMAYAGHQFANFVPQLGDGRAILLGEIRRPDGTLLDVQLKGSGITPFSRGGDGRAALGPMLREYLISEAMHALGIPTTRSLAVVTTGEPVFRSQALPGAVLARVASSHIRVGTFQYFAARDDQGAVRELFNYVIVRHYPEARDASVPALAVLDAVADRQAALIADWMRVGFIHGVMNTDNMAISGETIDYGPCAFMDQYDPKTVFSSIDQRGRYAYANQPLIAQWNLARLAETLLPLIDSNEDKAVELATASLARFMEQFDRYFLEAMRRKLGLSSEEEHDSDLVTRLLGAMESAKADFTASFRALTSLAETSESKPQNLSAANAFMDFELLAPWLQDWRRRLARDPQSAHERVASMRRSNAAFIPRNHLVEEALAAASDDGDFAPFQTLLAVLQNPYDDPTGLVKYAQPPAVPDGAYQTFCGT